MFNTSELDELFWILISIKGFKLRQPQWSNTTVDGAQRSFNPTNQGNFNKVGRPGGYVNRQNSGNNTQSNGRENFKSFR